MPILSNFPAGAKQENASATVAGITKLYGETGTNTDGALTQKAASEALAEIPTKTSELENDSGFLDDSSIEEVETIDVTGGEVGQVLMKTEDGAEWASVSVGGTVVLDSIRITSAPTKTAYKAGETFSTAGMEVKADYSNGTVVIVEDIVVTGWNVSPSGPLTAGTTYVTVQYTENGVTKMATQTISVTKTQVAVPSQSGSLTYSGSAQSPSWSSYNSSLVTLGGTTSGTNAGSYNATFAIKNTELYCWTDGTTAVKTVAWTIGKATGTLSVSTENLTLNPSNLSGSFSITTNSTGAVSFTNSNTSILSVSFSGSTFSVVSIDNKSGTAVITVTVAADNNHTEPPQKSCTVKCSFISTYGVEWDGTSTTTLSRTDDSATFVDPSPAISNGTGSSPFDNLMPWSGMVRVTDETAGELVAIPKFYYKWTTNGNTRKLQIADGPVEGFYVSPAHADRGDGSGERDMVYVGRYHCASDYKSTTGVAQACSITRSAARSSVHNLGSSYWQFDYAMRLTIQMLYLVEFADWNSQTKIGYGCSASGSKENNGQTDAMQYHTGTTASSRTTYGFTQYRYIEGLWDNVYDWMDGCYYSSSGMSVILNPNNFSDSANGTVIGTPSDGFPSAIGIAEASGVQWIYPTAAGGNSETYIPDNWSFNSSSPCLRCGGYYSRYLNLGLFYVYCNVASYGNTFIGCRLQKLP